MKIVQSVLMDMEFDKTIEELIVNSIVKKSAAK